MSRLPCLLILAALAAPPAEAREARDGPGASRSARWVPVRHDLRRLDRLDARLIRHGFVPVSRVPPRRGPARDPSGVTGFSGPPGIIGDSVNSLAPLPPGSPASLDGQLY
ncbi:hypothetical protein M446_0714 [Methylobacterium sp. 4-46]|uniref:hypothetical protein n=1 Tax=unclassified Methylobacterium TaxID=2615210 RepID=UPI000152C31A|nr:MULTISPECIES: hypothetical protein [Methylobacterium]ACA15274.1 hypothetical protein M446_0714 [Methylobacterium sp. 4-46]WFT81001.1 hypothetical protein QA634_03610 [Methylobacterium nodulans]